MTDGPTAPRWVLRAIDEIEACPFAQVVGRLQAPNASRPETLQARRSCVLYDAYRRLDARRFGAAEDPCDPIDISARIEALPTLEATVPGTGSDLDVVLALGHRRPDAAVLERAPFGVWCVDGTADEAPLFAEVYEQAPVARSALHRLTSRPDAPEVLYESFSATHAISLHRTRSRAYWKSAHFAARKLGELHREGALSVAARYGQAPRLSAARPTPTNRQMLGFAGRVAMRLARRKARELLSRQQWFLGYQRRGPGLPTSATVHGATVIRAPHDRFYADPCLVDWHGATYLFFEAFGFAAQKGVIACCRVTEDGRHTPPRVVLERPYHLSYPSVFVVGDDAFMLPETAANGAIELYKAQSFPTSWALDAVLVRDVDAVDPTLVEHDGRYWLFANVAVEGASHDDELCLFSAEALVGPWVPHPRNPIVSDVRRARPAGRPFVDERGALIRPSQDCSAGYGSAVVFNRIDELSAAQYREVPVGRLEPGWRAGNLGTHTYARSDLWEAFDGRAWVRRR